MILRSISILLFVLGGWMVMTAVMAAFIDVEPGVADNLLMLAIVAILAVPLLLLGAWASPGVRGREVGLTLLISAAIGAGCGLVALLVLNDPTAIRLMPQPMPHIDLAPAFGAVNLLLVVALGWWLYRRRVRA